MNPIYYIASTAGVLLILYVLLSRGKSALLALRNFANTIELLEKSIALSTEETKSLRETMASFPEWTRKMAELSAQQMEHTARMTQVIDNLNSSLFGKDNKGYMAYVEQDANQEWEIRERMKHGDTREDAEKSVKNASMWDGLKFR